MDYFREHGKGIRMTVASVVLLFVLTLLTGGNGSQEFFFPLLRFAGKDASGMTAMLNGGIYEMMPLCNYGRELGAGEEMENMGEESQVVLHIAQGENGEGSRVEPEDTEQVQQAASGEPATEAAAMDAQTLREMFVMENRGKVAEYDWHALSDYETLLSTFYTIDANALAGNDLFAVQTLLEKNMTIQKDSAAPQILIYHTHSKEGYADSTPGEQSESVVGVGDFLTRILQEQYGYNVLHHTAEYDTVRDDAYAKSLPALEQLLADNPSIEVVIDLHRDASNPSREMVVDVNGRPTARFMFFNGISRSKRTGNIDYLDNPNLAENLAFSFQMQRAAGEYYPGLTRKIYIKQYRYNMHLRGKSLLIELGDESNTLEEAMNACYPLAHLLDMVLSGNGQ